MPRSTQNPRYRLSPGAVLFAALIVAVPARAADDAALARCREITDPAARPAFQAREAPQAKPPAEQFGLENRAPPPKTMTEQFGLEDRGPPPKMLGQIDTRVLGTFEGWWPDAFIKLVNGQVWQVTDGTSRFYQLESPNVTISRGFGGAFYLNVAGDKWTVRVRRVQ
jgi:hypothetical protein